jgi:thiol-disulfide isomerase/thioredoxin
MKKLVLTLIAILFFNKVFCQITNLLPKYPKYNDQISFTYNSSESGALLTGNETVYASININLQNGSLIRETVKTTKEKELFKGTYKLPANCASFSLGFFTNTKSDAYKSYRVFNSNEKPVQGAYFMDFGYRNQKMDSIFQLEINNYPSNFEAYGLLFMFSMPAPYSTNLDNALKNYMPVIEKAYLKKANTDNLGLIFSLCIGNCKNGKLDIAEKFIIEMLSKFPESPYTAKALGSFNYDYYKSSNETKNKNVIEKLKEVALTKPYSQVVYENIYFLSDFNEIPIENFEKAILPRIEKDSTNFEQAIQFVEICVKRKQKLENAERIIKKAIRVILQSPTDIMFTDYPEYQLAQLFSLYSEINCLNNNYLDALQHINSAINLATDNSYDSKAIIEYTLQRARIYQKIGNLNLAIKEYALLEMKGETTALDSIKSIHRQITNKPGDFQNYYANIEKFLQNKIKYDPAPDFTVFDLDSNKYVLHELRGKVVVLNFWGIGCGPCVKEMPDLNKIVAKYKNNPNVVFIAFTGDSKENLKEFFKNKSFDYKIAITREVQRKYKLSGIPKHIVIDRNGNIIKKVEGADPNIENILINTIDNTLQKS